MTDGIGTVAIDKSILNADFSDELTLIDPATVAFRDDGGNPDGLTVERGTYKVMFLAFPFEEYGSATDKSDLDDPPLHVASRRPSPEPWPDRSLRGRRRSRRSGDGSLFRPRFRCASPIEAAGHDIRRDPGHVDSRRNPSTEDLELTAHARRIGPDTGPTDRRRLAAAGLSAVLPGLGQAFNRRRELAVLFARAVPVVAARGAGDRPAAVAGPALAWIVAPQVLGIVLTLNVVVLAWRLIAVGQAFLDTSRAGPTGRLGVVGIVVIALLVALPHLVVYRYGTILGDTFARIFQGAGFADDPGVPPPPVPADGERINVLLVGVDKLPNRSATLTDTMMVASLDPVGKTVSLVSVPRDLIDTPLGDGNVFGPKLNSLLGYADAHHDQFPKGGMRTLEDAIGALLDIPIHYYARIDFVGFIDMVDAVGGVDVTVAKGFEDPGYDGFGFGEARLVDHRRATPPRRPERAGLRAVAQGGRRERLHPGRPPAADPGRPARQGDQWREPPVPAPRPAGRGGPDDPIRRAGRQVAGAGGDHGGDLAPKRGQRRHPVPARPPQVDPLRRLAGAGPGGDPGGRRGLFSPPGTPPKGWTPPK